MKQYLATLRNIYENGIDHADRSGIGRRSIFGVQDRYNIEGYRLPLVTTRQAFTKFLIHETLWFISGSMDTTVLKEKGMDLWDKWALDEVAIEAFVQKYFPDDKDTQELFRIHYRQQIGSIGPLYGHNWRNAPNPSDGPSVLWPQVPLDEIPSDKLPAITEQYEFHKNDLPDNITFEQYASAAYYETYDQLNELIRNLKHRPHSSRHVVNAWIPQYVPFEDLPPKENIILGKSALTACHTMFQVFIHPAKEEGGKKRLSLMMTIRSNDYLVGGVFNIAQYALLAMMLAHCNDMEPYEYIHSVGDCHLYLDQIPVLEEHKQLEREPMTGPTVWLNPEKKDIFQFTPEDIKIENYRYHPRIDYPISA